MKQNYAVIGLGLFGSSIVNTLLEHDQEVLVIDKSEARVNEFRDRATEAIVADTQNELALNQLGIGNFDNVFVAIGTDLEASIMTTMICEELGVKNLICKAENARHAKVLEKLGADEVIQPERDMGQRIALHVMEPKILNDLKLKGELSVIEFELTNPKLFNKTLKELNLTNRYKISVIALSHADENGAIIPNQSTITKPGDIVTIIGTEKDVEAFEAVATA
ncbi:potassium channel family protein [Lentilactobacillus buchneri]|uniref:Trk family potassium (K+) transporter, NAD+ binding protein n=2 Tax=Lentilactobacillus buchneri TaxID=1581 RepID=J9WAN6_LENBU|nr:TrkA family potassium uptake protein [Lentilactobacillus buchneri]MCC6101561.1 TrkA family potassium uptake protein [Lactobacillus sp.]WCJ52535.1 TrkA family potassium uptake protein [Lentilactobacillus sp. Egmn17]AEB74285.1 TrkA-N domain protein [Lentilactobacillus buchneri NRRL B-30929]AFS01116.1 Trk family potassium (K+) transporter, NAD+ binding protein [Lentilactobacillus buchneri subsp. silagei CD034]KRK69579.1 TrkA-N domain-containing protein [Lentilactobacillus buchneri DSM 20057]